MYAPETLVIDTWTSPVSISGTDLIKNLDEAVNSIVSTDVNSIKNHVNRELAKIPTYLSTEATKIYDETNLSAVSALDSKNSALASATTATDKATIATTKALEASISASEALASKNLAAASAGNALTSEQNADASEALALSYKNSAEASATTATTQAGIATTKASDASTSASNALASEIQAGIFAGQLDPSKIVAKDSPTGASFNPVGTTAQRPTMPTNGYIRYNTDLLAFEGYSNGAWTSLGGSATGGGIDKMFFLNDQIITADYIIPIGKNAMTTGNVTIASGITVTVSGGSKWVIL